MGYVGIGALALAPVKSSTFGLPAATTRFAALRKIQPKVLLERRQPTTPTYGTSPAIKPLPKPLPTEWRGVVQPPSVAAPKGRVEPAPVQVETPTTECPAGQELIAGRCDWPTPEHTAMPVPGPTPSPTPMLPPAQPVTIMPVAPPKTSLPDTIPGEGMEVEDVMVTPVPTPTLLERAIEHKTLLMIAGAAAVGAWLYWRK